MTVRIKLSVEEREILEHTFKNTADRRLRERCQAVLMADRGRLRRQIAQDLGAHRTSVHRWLRAYLEGGLEGLEIQWSAGQPPRIPAELAETIKAWVKEGPASCGLQRANWTYPELATHLYHTHGIEVGETAMREFCHRHAIRPYRPTYRFLRADPERQPQAREDLAALKKKPRPGTVSC